MRPSKKERWQKVFFRKIAPSYDLVNTLISFGLHHHWRNYTIEKADLQPGHRVLDVCCGTGMITKDLAQKVGPQGKVVGLDLSPAMLKIAAQNLRAYPWIELVEGNALALPFPNDVFDRTVIGYGLRNVADPRQALAELFRVLKPGGKVAALELAKPRAPVFNRLHRIYTAVCLPLVGYLFTGDKKPYQYLHHSIQTYPAPEKITRIFQEIGFTNVCCTALSWGVVTIHVANKPGP
ncbi:MAG: bifunctional demethylmenaquinone methyltransferase/2-methoxy-6-polyprenyl-1,4-benzoquinol methylase UbiE [Firmicutes bacterium]|nr:bifunctional demethylmenaquinone methyltransferase/2-methoxy-6-polyprenyl-1,4-benzoquinol methylase UbiE [Bacillota bacterium]